MNDFPIFKFDQIFNIYNRKNEIGKIQLKCHKISIFYPCRLDAMAINPGAVVKNNNNMKFSPGEVVVSIDLGLKISIKVLSATGGKISISETTKRKVLVKHACALMFDALEISPSLYVDVDDSDVVKHCGFGSSSSTIAGVCAAINELYDKPICNDDLIKYVASNHGEEVCDRDEDNLKLVQCIGGGASNGLTKEGILIISGCATVIAKLNYSSNVLIAIPNKFKVRDANEMMQLEEKNLYKFARTGKKYKEKIAYEMLHKVLPDIANNDISSLGELVYKYRFYMGSNINCSFVYPPIKQLNKTLRILYEEKHCIFLSLSSVGPAFFCFVDNKEDELFCKNFFEENDMRVIKTAVHNDTYNILERSL